MNTQLPTGWVQTAISELVTFNPKTDATDDTQVGFVPMAGLGMQYRDGLKIETRLWGDVKKSYTHFQSGDVLVAKVTPCFENGKAGLAQGLPNGLGAGSSEFCVFRPTQSLDQRYLLAWFSTDNFRKRATLAMTGSVGLKRVPKDVFLSDQLPLAPLAEQKRIADKLDAVLARVDAVNTRLARVALLLKRFRQSVLAAATSGRLTEDWRKSLSTSGYPTYPLNQLADMRLGKMLDKAKNSGQLVKYLRNVNVRWLEFDLSDLQELRVESHELASLSIRDGDLLICEGGEPGRCAVWQYGETDLIFQKALHRVRPDESKLLSRWLAFVLKDQCDSGTIAQLFTGSTIKHLTGTALAKLPVPLPSIEEQTEIVRRVETLFAFADRLQARLAQAQTAANRLTPALLAKAFRGELVPQDPNDEPAAELLRRLAQAPTAKVSKARKAKNNAAASLP